MGREFPSPLLEIHDLRTYFDTPWGVVRAVDGVDLAVTKGGTTAVVGESGCGKTVLALSILRLVPRPAGRIVSGIVLFENKDLLRLDERSMREIRGKEISMIFQEPMNALNPVLTVGEQIKEVLVVHGRASSKEATDITVELLKRVGISMPEKRIKNYPHQLSGGMRQRVMIAMAIACTPKMLIADEPTTALDVTVQAQILDLLAEIQKKTELGIILITHDLSIVAEMADAVAVMYAGEVVEYAVVKELFSNPKHPYTIGLMESIPVWTRKYGKRDRLKTINGYVLSIVGQFVGCRFQDRCPMVTLSCKIENQVLRDCGDGHMVRCWKTN
ncbi:MAG: ABC transporter ATP-binding protein [Syntrophales bacterium]|nr:ABC transporter ATP-binding protein [Syntrophales bacterium]